MKNILLAVLTVSAISADPIHVRLDTHQTKINFTLGDVLHTVHGTFQLTDGEIWVDPGSGKAGGKIVVASRSGESGSHARDSRMQKNVLQASVFPDITFAPDRVDGNVEPIGDSTFQLHGTFGIHGAAHELTMAVKCHIEAGHVNADASFNVPYVSWGMKDPSTLFLRVSNVVKIDISAVGNTASR